MDYGEGRDRQHVVRTALSVAQLSTLKRNRRNKKCMNTVLDLSMVKKNKESWARSYCSTEEERKAKCCSLCFP